MDNLKPSRRLSLRLGLLAVLAGAAALRLWRLDQNGFGNEYYTAGVRSMSLSWHNFLYNSFDPAGFISVDKPPVALWIQVASVKLFGFHALGVLIPQALEGVAASRSCITWFSAASAPAPACCQPPARRRRRGAAHRRLGPREGADRGPGPLALERARRPPERDASLRSATGPVDRRQSLIFMSS
jgi:hypothetical protein